MKPHYKSYTIAAKIQAIETAKRTSNRNAARVCKVDVKRIREWRKQELHLRSVAHPEQRTHLRGGGRPVRSIEVEEELVEWINEQRAKSLRVTRKGIQRQAILLSTDETFLASDGWLSKFLRRNRFSLRKRTTIAQKRPDDIKDKIISYLLFVKALRQNCSYRDNDIGAADETAISFDPVQNNTVDKVGTKRVPLISTGYQKQRVTVMLAAKSNGTKLKPFIVFKGKRIPEELKEFRGAEIYMTGSGWMTDAAIIEWIKKVWATFSFGRCLLSWDAFRCHRTESVKRELKKLRTDVAMIPGGCTGLLQAPDVSWIKPFKTSFTGLYEEWMRTEGCTSQNLTNAGNLRPPAKLQICRWITKAWDSVSDELIKSSFEICGLSCPLDGSGDYKIHAIKELDILSDLRNRRALIPVMDIEEDVSSSDDSLTTTSSDENDH